MKPQPIHWTELPGRGQGTPSFLEDMYLLKTAEQLGIFSPRHAGLMRTEFMGRGGNHD